MRRERRAMNRTRRTICAATLLLPTLTAGAGAQPGGPKASISLHTDRTSYAPGDTAELDILLEIASGWHVNSHEPTYEYLISTEAEITVPPGWAPPSVRYPPGTMESFAFVDTPISVYSHQVVIESDLVVPQVLSSDRVVIGVSLRYQACNDRSCLPPTTAQAKLPLTLGSSGEPTKAGARAGEPAAAGRATTGLLGFLALGVLGGLLLNAMPCVLPVLSLKVMGLVKSSGIGRRGVTVGALATAAGIVVSFWALAGAAVAAKLAGSTVGWGVQFQQPTFVVFLTVVVLLFCLNLWGVFEVPLPSRVAGWAEATGSEGLPGHFTAGLFATLLATPCSAPFLGTAVGFALSQRAFFTAVGVGMALPYLAIAVAPGSIRMLPKPGAWMERFRVLMGFFLAAAAVWLLYVLSSQVSRERLAFVELALLALAFFVWLRSSARAGGAWFPTLGIIGSLILVLALAAGGAGAQRDPARSSLEGEAEHLIDWIEFDRLEAESLRDEGRLVFVDVTADWCFTCKVNERLALETAEVAAAFESAGVVAMKADWTNRDDDIARFLADHGRYGIPFYLLYRPGRKPHLFGELITKETLVEAIAAASQ